ncbi:MAG TPA: preprotein translocase subunit YajC [Acidimicrobiales bacterium]|nr:preprotein translocase subunit YajC [Acidimicrobiales bacterium]
MGGLEIFLLPLLLIGLLWFMGAPQRKMRKEQAALMESLAPGADVMTHGGLYGTVVEIDDDVVVLETSPGVTMRWAKRAIATVVTPLGDDEAVDESDEELDEEYADEEYTDEEYTDEDEATDESVEASEDTADDWEDVEVPDDASSLTSSEDDGDDKPTR